MTDRLELLPAVDVADGQAVRLTQGAAGTEIGYGDPLSAALDWYAGGAEWIHLVDLDAAFGRGSNAALLAEVAASFRQGRQGRASGRDRDEQSVEWALSTGASRMNLGTAALENPSWTARMIGPYGDRSPSASTCAAPRSRRGAGPRTGATSGRSSPGSRTSAASATW